MERPRQLSDLAGDRPATPRLRVYRSLAELNKEIDACTVCSGFVSPLGKTQGLVRGGLAPVMIVGQGPGNSEVARGRAFAGQSGTRLDQWLVACGAPQSAPRESVYLTSVIKCVCPKDALYKRMAHRCLPFLLSQITLVKPGLVITLGAKAYEALTFTTDSYREAIGNAYRSADHVFFTQFNHHFTLLPWPHPSGLNRALNDARTLQRLRASYAIVRPFLTDAA
jgi:uracil-DNA glycosylase family 4